VFQKDPYLDLFVLLAVLGTFSLLIVQTITMAAVVRYFAHHHPEENAVRTKIAPGIGGLGMLTVVILMIMNLDTAAGTAASSLLFKLIPYVAVALFAFGCSQALYLRRADPERYDTIGHVVLATDLHAVVVVGDDDSDPETELRSSPDLEA
jgi:hypothetical protein